MPTLPTPTRFLVCIVYPSTSDNSNRPTEQDEKAAMNEDNIIDERTRGAAKPKGTYTEPGDEEVSLF
jgi:hypothetical protein